METFLTEDEIILHLIATAIVRLTSQQKRKNFLSAPYPIELQRGLDLLTVNAFRRGRIAPRTVLDILDWCQNRPLAQWPLEFEGRELAYDALLLVNGRPTSWCEEWACSATNVVLRIVLCMKRSVYVEPKVIINSIATFAGY